MSETRLTADQLAERFRRLAEHEHNKAYSYRALGREPLAHRHDARAGAFEDAVLLCEGKIEDA